LVRRKKNIVLATSKTSASTSNDRVVSLLDKLKHPTPADIARRRRVKTNPSPASNKQRYHGTSSSPKTITPHQQVKQFGEPLIGYLFYRSCIEQISTKLSVNKKNHSCSTKHTEGKEWLKKKEAREKHIVECLRKHNDTTHMRGKTLPEDQQVYRVQVVSAFLKAGVPLAKIDHFRELLEEHVHRLTDRRNMNDYVPFILQPQEQCIHYEINGKILSVVFDGTAGLGEVLAIILRFVSDDWTIQQRLVRVQLLTKSLTGEEIARELIIIFSFHYGVQPTRQLLWPMRDQASTNNVAMQTMKVVYPNLINIGCYSHMIDQVGNCFNTTTLDEFMMLGLVCFHIASKQEHCEENKLTIACSPIQQQNGGANGR